MHRLHLLPLVLIVLTLGACQQTGSTRVAEDDPRLDGKLTLYRLNGDRYPGDTVQPGEVLLKHWPILETRPITDRDDARAILGALDAGIAAEAFIPIDCFNPRHALRIEQDGSTIDYLICFQCRNYYAWRDDEEDPGLGGNFGSEVKPVFERLLLSPPPSP